MNPQKTLIDPCYWLLLQYGESIIMSAVLCLEWSYQKGVVDTLVVPDPMLIEQQNLIGWLHFKGNFPIGQSSYWLLRMVVLSIEL